MIQKQARQLDFPADVWANHFRKVIKNWIRLAFRALQASDIGKLSVFGERVKSCSGVLKWITSNGVSRSTLGSDSRSNIPMLPYSSKDRF
jgi:hypothetical protein